VVLLKNPFEIVVQIRINHDSWGRPHEVNGWLIPCSGRAVAIDVT